MSNIHTNIKVLRTEARLTQEEFAEKMNVSVETVVLWEKGKLDPTSREITLMCPILRIHEEDFLERDILQERNDAGRRMKQGSSRSTYDWYYGSRTKAAFYISYLVLIPVVMLITYFMMNKVIGMVDITEESKDLITMLNMYKWVYTIGAGGFVSSIYVIIYLFRNRIITFRYWYIFIIGTLISIMVVVCSIAMIGLYGYAFYKGIIKKGKNR